MAIFDLAGAARRVGRSERTLRRWQENGEVTFVLGRIREADLLEADRRMRGKVGRPRKSVKPVQEVC